MIGDPFHTLEKFCTGYGQEGLLYSLPALEQNGIGRISRLPVTIRIILESVLRNWDGHRISDKDVHTLANWNARSPDPVEIPFVAARIVLQDFTGVPLLVDLAAMRSAVRRFQGNPDLVEPLVPVDLVVDHSVQVDFYGTPQALHLNLEMEFTRNRERYQALKWGQQAFKNVCVVPPGIGIVHQVNLEYLAKGILSARYADGEVFYPDSLVGTDSHTTMINGLGIVGWGVGGIEAEAGMLGRPVYFLTPEVIGVHLAGRLREGVTATDLALSVTQTLRASKVVGKFVEFYGEGARSLTLPDRATIANMAPEYGATMGFFPVDEESISYLRLTGRSEAQVATFERYFKVQKMFGMPDKGDIDYSTNLELDLSRIQPSVAGPKRPQDRISLHRVKKTFQDLLAIPVSEGGYGKKGSGKGAAFATTAARNGSPKNDIEMVDDHPTLSSNNELHCSAVHATNTRLRDGSILIAAITSCTNTSNPSVMIGAGLLAKKAVQRGMRVEPSIKTSLAPGSRIVEDYLRQTGLQFYLDQLGFNIVGYGCTTCIGNSGPLNPEIERTVVTSDLVGVAVLSGNRNFEARIHQSVRANFLMSPPLVVAFALAGYIDVDLVHDPISKDLNGKDVYLREIWPSTSEIREVMADALRPEVFRRLYADFVSKNSKWDEIEGTTGKFYQWDHRSTYIQEPPFFEDFSIEPASLSEIYNARPLAILGDSVTTDHISPAGAIQANSPAGEYLIECGIQPRDFNSYGSRRGNDRVMTRGTFSNARIRNLMLPNTEGGVSIKYPEAEQRSIYNVAMAYKAEGVPLVVIAGQEYGAGSSRDWAAKGTKLLGVRAVIAIGYERIHRSNLVGMGVLPLQFPEGISAKTLQLDGTEKFSVLKLNEKVQPRQALILRIERKDGSVKDVEVQLRVDTCIEVDYLRHGGILPLVLRKLLVR
ncbi:Aconitate hydratase [Candidatus Xiphinematobacter sp. Idaho Grape]|uniref:aconitate hydratase AcnA n=1 Tax=Candidatus Xiphinematobacter sp. Idaho Grape TaxID=1704307 RepID=UPI0007067903|nr:aconitate hydratase AcnA [Candidatus Xiphinematobacter sp. Idaho Grape]ALJ56952.1 Aconitate hydratase [Candidatus Xiphinematobacter sp. Idaho Grape]